MTDLPVCLSVAGSDSGGGAGIQIDNRTFQYFDCYSVNVLTAVTSQSHTKFNSQQLMSADFVADQLSLLIDTYRPQAIKTGMLGNEEICSAIVPILSSYDCPLIIDPVIMSTTGVRLLTESAIDILRNDLFPQAALITPNIPELKALFALKSDNFKQLIYDLADLKLPYAVLLKGGHRSDKWAIDVLIENQMITLFKSPTISR